MTSANKPVALVTGASSGMGKDFALRLIAEGYAVYGAARRTDAMGGIAAAGGIVLTMDVTDDASMVAGVEQIVREQGRIDVLINNAGYGQYGALEDVPIDVGRRQMEVNLFGPARLVQLCLPPMRAQRGGKIVNISSIGGRFALPIGGWYHASKFALEAYSDALRNEVRAFGVDVIVIEPGGIATAWGGIARDEAQRWSGQGAYAGLLGAFRRRRAGPRQGPPPPKVISDLVMRALKARRPKTRYHGGMMAAQMLFLRRWLPDRLFDRVIMSAMR